MVSQPEPLAPSASSLSHRGGPASAVSRPSLSRTRRYNRSHTGGPSSSSSPLATLQNDFPVFASSGDVDIVVRARDVPPSAAPVENRYLLHRHTLTRCSGFFEASTAPDWSRGRALPAGNELSRIGEDGDLVPLGGESPAPGVRSRSGSASGSATGSARKRWRYELDPAAGDGDVPMLVQCDESTRDMTAQSLFGPRPGSSSGSGPGPGPGPGPSANSRSRRGYSRSHSNSVSSAPATAASNHSFFRSVANLSLSHSHARSASSSSSSSSAAAAAAAHHAAPALSQADQDLLRDYDNMFRIFYNYPPCLDGVNVADAYVQCKSLLVLADRYDALAVVGPRVDHHMLQFQSRLWRQIAKYPVSYLRLGYLARSRIMFQEALVHVVGQWPVGERSLRAALPDVVLDVIEDKVDELEETVNRVEGRLFRLGLSNARGERVAPTTNYLDWLALSLFRQWLADNTSPQPPAPAPAPDAQQQRRRPGSRDTRAPPALPPAAPPLAIIGRAYRTLGLGSPASFLGHDECKRFLKLTPELYSRDNLRRFEKRIDELKSMAREIVRPLMGSSLELDVGGSSRASADITYLTCTSVRSRDLPWGLGD